MKQHKAVVGQLENESIQDYVKFLVFLQLGSSRSLDKAFQKYYDSTDGVSKTWRTLAVQYQWVQRASEYDNKP